MHLILFCLLSQTALTRAVASTINTPPSSSSPSAKFAAIDETLGHVALGIGYPDIRARLSLGLGIATEVKFALEEGIFVYTGKLSWNYWSFGPLKALAAIEAGRANIDNTDGVSGGGGLAGMQLALEYPFAKNFRVSVDAGPVWLGANSGYASYSNVAFVYNTALYYYLR